LLAGVGMLMYVLHDFGKKGKEINACYHYLLNKLLFTVYFWWSWDVIPDVITTFIQTMFL